MPVIVAKDWPYIGQLQEEKINIMDSVPRGIKPLRIALLNLMPMKEYAEMDFYRMLSQSSLYAQVTLVKFVGQRYKNAPQEYVEAFYTNFQDLRSQEFDGFIITGAPVEQMPFEEVRYWDQMKEVYAWCEERPEMPKLHICWGCQAALYAQFGIHKHMVPQKVFGIFEQMAKPIPLFYGLTPNFAMPQSRHTEMVIEELAREDRIEIVASSPLSGPGVIKRKDRAEFYITGHMEYSPMRIDFEYHRDLEKNLPIHLPYNYYEDDDPEGQIIYSWREPAMRFFTNWLERYVYKGDHI
ncbi:MAG: homoserine O-succinyltransferase [Bacteroidaceae bacterium]|nr:homoserine O-succinyltransferase [Bacteroidaceae bacterium]